MTASAAQQARGSRLLSVMCLFMACVLPSAPLYAGEAEGRPAAQGASHFRDVMLAAHNSERIAQGVAPLVWSEALAADAAQSAAHLAQQPDPVAAHGKTGGSGSHGENMWAGTRGTYALEEMTGSWLEERALYLDGPVPEISRSGNWADVGHYSQIIWAGTRRIGCALAVNAEVDVLVCRYDPAGNIYGHHARADYARR